jgi:hypothetical protein
MTSTRQENQQAGLAAFEVLVVLITLGLLAGIFLLYPRKKVTSAATWSACLGNLKSVGLAQLVWADGHATGNGTNDLPAADPNILKHLGSGGIASYYKALSNELIAPRILKCPSENRNYATNFSSLTASHISYFLNLSALSPFDTSKVMNGDRYITFTPEPAGQPVTIAANLSVRWTKKMGHGDGNVALVDGSVQRTSSRELAKTLLPPSNNVPQRLLFP